MQALLKKIDDYRFLLPRTYQPGMRTDGLIYSTEKMLPDIIHDKAVAQVANVACLPGIVGYSLAMPDIHWGYGFPIGGVAATSFEKDGVVSPGGVGFDINCLCGESMVLSDLGYRRKIKDYEHGFLQERLSCMDFKNTRPESTAIALFLRRKVQGKVYKVKVSSGKEIIATSDHPFYTKDGMRCVSRIRRGEQVALYPFEGVEYQQPSSEMIVDHGMITKYLLGIGKDSRGNALSQISKSLSERNLLPLRYDSPQLPYLLKVMGYCWGDGTIYFTNKREKGVVCLYGKECDLRDIKSDLEKIGLVAGQIYSRHRHHKIKTFYGICEFDRKGSCLKITSSSLATLLAVLGVPVGNKARVPFSLPGWLWKASLWQKRLFLASFFGAELSSPKTLTNHGFTFYCPTLSMNKNESVCENGEAFLKEIAQLLAEFGIRTHPIGKRKEYVNKDGSISYRLRLLIAGDIPNLLRHYRSIGFEYNQQRKFLSNVAIQYLTLKQLRLHQREEVAAQAKALYTEEGAGPQALIQKFSSYPWINKRFLQRTLYEDRKTSPRIGETFMLFEEFLRKSTEGLGHSGMVWDAVEDITEIEGYDDFVYDFMVEQCDHNFIANNFVVSNCGVRLVRTDLRYKEINDKIEPLINRLFNDVPSGVGSAGSLVLGTAEFKKVLVSGVRWAVERGMAEEEDRLHCEEQGCLEGADPDAISEKAYRRGKDQQGTLGSGNHFLEIQEVTEIFDESAASEMGIFTGQVTVMIHSGSRGFGHQVCEDYLSLMQKAMVKYRIRLPDRQLACAPLNSPEAEQYFSAMNAAANYAWCNRQVLMHLVRQCFAKVFRRKWQEMGMRLIYDVAHNIAKKETYVIDGKPTALCVHRKGATRALGKGNPLLPPAYKDLGQPVIIPGDMGSASYLLLGTRKAEEETFSSTCHGAGRIMSRSEALRTVDLNRLLAEMEKRNIKIRAAGKRTIVEEAPGVYKNIDDVVGVVVGAGISRKVARMRPLAVVKG